jgi:hypothetical protein
MEWVFSYLSVIIGLSLMKLDGYGIPVLFSRARSSLFPWLAVCPPDG